MLKMLLKPDGNVLTCRTIKFTCIRWLETCCMRRRHWSTTVQSQASSTRQTDRCLLLPTRTAKCCSISCPTTPYVVLQCDESFLSSPVWAFISWPSVLYCTILYCLFFSVSVKRLAIMMWVVLYVALNSTLYLLTYRASLRTCFHSSRKTTRFLLYMVLSSVDGCN